MTWGWRRDLAWSSRRSRLGKEVSTWTRVWQVKRSHDPVLRSRPGTGCLGLLRPAHAQHARDLHKPARDQAPMRAQPACRARSSAHDLGTARSVRATWVVGCAHCAPNPVLIMCTVYSHCLDHCSWTLFMITVHMVKIKNKKNMKF